MGRRRAITLIDLAARILSAIACFRCPRKRDHGADVFFCLFCQATRKSAKAIDINITITAVTNTNRSANKRRILTSL